MRGDKVLKLAKGFRGRAKNCVRVARERVEKALQYATRDRRAHKRDFRSGWVVQIGAGAREHGLTYSTFISGLKTQGVTLNRKVLAALASQEPLSFKALVDQVGAMRGDSRPPRPPVGPGA